MRFSPLSDLQTRADIWHEVVLATLKSNNVKLITYVPDKVFTPLIKALHGDAFFTTFRSANASGYLARGRACNPQEQQRQAHHLCPGQSVHAADQGAARRCVFHHFPICKRERISGTRSCLQPSRATTSSSSLMSRTKCSRR